MSGEEVPPSMVCRQLPIPLVISVASPVKLPSWSASIPAGVTSITVVQNTCAAGSTRVIHATTFTRFGLPKSPNLVS